MAAGARGANVRNKNQAMAAAMKDTPHRKGIERLHMRCPLGCGVLIRREISGCKSEQKGDLENHLFKCKGKARSALRFS